MFIERSPGWAKKLKSGVSIEDKGNSQVVVGEMSHLMVPDNSVGAILIKDVFGSEGVPTITSDSKMMPTNEEVGDIREITTEIARVLKDGGKLVILEMASPERASKDELIKLFQEKGLTLKKVYAKNELHKVFEDKEMGESVSKFADSKGYALVFEKS